MTGEGLNRRGWRVLDSVHSFDERHCVDYFEDADGKFGFAEFRSDPEDQGGWTLIRQSSERFSSMPDAVVESRLTVPWIESEKGRQ